MTRWLPWLLLVVLAVGDGLDRSHQGTLERRIAAREATIAALTHEADSLRVVVRVDTVQLTAAVTRWRTLTVHDTLPGRVDTLPGVRQLIVAGDTVVRACQVTVADCAHLAATERARGDSLAAQVADWRRLAGGPWIRPALELTTGPGGLIPAGEVTIGRRLSLLGRLEAPLTQTPTWRVGVRWSF